MTTPGGVPNLPVGALTLDTLAANLQDMSGTAMKSRAVERFPSIMDSSTGLNPALDITPFGILTRIWAETNSLVANADPADIDGPEDLPELLLEFIEGIPVIGQFVQLIEAILGTYDGDDEVLLAIQAIFAPIRALMQLFSGLTEGLPNVDQITSGINEFLGAFAGLDLTDPGAVLASIETAIAGIVNGIIQTIIDAVVGALTGSTETGNDPTAMFGVLLAPLTLITNTMTFLESIASTLGGLSGGLDARVAALEASVLGASGLVSGDNFNRAAIGGTWTNVAGTLAISAGDYVRTPDLSAGYYNAGNPDTDQHGAAVKLVARYAGDCRFFICSDTAMANYVAVETHLGIFGDDYIRLVTGSSPTVVVTHTQANYAGYRLQENDVLAVRYDSTLNTYFVSRNGAIVPELTWEDTTNVVTHGALKREVGIVSNSLNQSAFPGFGITDFVFYDL